MFRSCWAISGRIVLIHYGCVYTVMHNFIQLSVNVPSYTQLYTIKCVCAHAAHSHLTVQRNHNVSKLFSLKMAQQDRNMQETFTNKDYIYFGALVGVYYFVSSLLLNSLPHSSPSPLKFQKREYK
jgi:hypothetical protein